MALAAVGTVTAGVLAGIGCVIAVQLTERSVIREVLIGCGVSWLASCAGAIPLSLAISARSKQVANAILGSTLVRFLVVLLLVVPLALAGRLDKTAFVLAVGLSYLGLLGVDTFVAARAISRENPTEAS
jgi:hypothetical protein